MTEEKKAKGEKVTVTAANVGEVSAEVLAPAPPAKSKEEQLVETLDAHLAAARTQLMACRNMNSPDFAPRLGDVVATAVSLGRAQEALAQSRSQP